jgi:dihydrofolate reductase
MGKLRFDVSISLDGYLAGPNPTLDEPLGKGGESLHDWMIELAVWREAHGMDGGVVNESTRVVEESLDNVGAVIMGRNMFGGGSGAWGDPPWQGWWGETPPFRNPVFVLTHYDREPLPMFGGTTFTFVTDGIFSALMQAREAAGDRDIHIAGGAGVIQQYLAKGLVDEFELHVAPAFLGGGTRLLDNLGPDIAIEQVRSIQTPGVTHLKYRVGEKVTN